MESENQIPLNKISSSSFGQRLDKSESDDYHAAGAGEGLGAEEMATEMERSKKLTWTDIEGKRANVQSVSIHFNPFNLNLLFS